MMLNTMLIMLDRLFIILYNVLCLIPKMWIDYLFALVKFVFTCFSCFSPFLVQLYNGYYVPLLMPWTEISDPGATSTHCMVAPCHESVIFVFRWLCVNSKQYHLQLTATWGTLNYTSYVSFIREETCWWPWWGFGRSCFFPEKDQDQHFLACLLIYLHLLLLYDVLLGWLFPIHGTTPWHLHFGNKNIVVDRFKFGAPHR
jgi:hypothetical protein